MSLQKESEWEKHYKDFGCCGGDYCDSPHNEELKDFIRKSIAEAVKADRKRIFDRLGFMRQWLNEDRITDHNKMVTDDELQHWLNPSKE